MIQTYGLQKIMAAFFHAAPLGNPANWYIALIDQNGNEFTAPSYARVEAKAEAAVWAVSDKVQNNVDIVWPQPLEQWGIPAAIRFYDAATVGQDWFQLPLSGDLALINANAPPPKLNMNTLTLRFDS